LKAEFTWRATVPAHWKVISNMPVEAERPVEGVETARTVVFQRSPRMSTYVTALCAGPYHEVRETHDGIDLGAFCRRSMARYFDADDIMLITRQGFDFFHANFVFRSPVTDFEYEQRANTSLHEMAHMWFGDLVTMRWWDDL